MELSDLTVEVRDKKLNRLGQIRPEEMDFEIEARLRNVGRWKLTLASEHPLAPALRTPGSGIVVIGADGVELFSGPTVTPENQATADDPGGTITFEGVDDTVILADALAYPQPSNPDPTTQTAAHDVRGGPVETLLHQYVNANIGPVSPAARRPAGSLARHLTMGTNLARGPVTQKSARFPVLGNLLAELAVVGGFNFRIVQRGAVLRFETYQTVDRSKVVRLDVHNNTLAGHRVAVSAPGATHVVVAGQGELVDRTFMAFSTAESVAAMGMWGRRIERFVDQRNTDDPAELTQAGMEVLEEEGFTSVAVQVVPMDDTESRMALLTHWGVGDLVTVVVEHQEIVATVSGYILKVNSDGVRLGATLGDQVGFDWRAAISKRITNTERRVSDLEREAEKSSKVWARPEDVIAVQAQVAAVAKQSVLNLMGVW